MFGKLAGVLGAAVLVTACDRSPVAPTMRTTSDNHVEPPGVLAAPDAGQRAGTRGDHVEPPGVLVTDVEGGREAIVQTPVRGTRR